MSFRLFEIFDLIWDIAIQRYIILYVVFDFVHYYQPSDIGWEDWIFAPVKWLAGKIVSEMTYNLWCRTINPTLSVCLFLCLQYDDLWLVDNCVEHPTWMLNAVVNQPQVVSTAQAIISIKMLVYMRVCSLFFTKMFSNVVKYRRFPVLRNHDLHYAIKRFRWPRQCRFSRAFFNFTVRYIDNKAYLLNEL